MNDEDKPGSQLFGVSIRSWNATIIIVLGMLTMCYISLVKMDAQWVMIPLSTALGFLFGKASGSVEASMKR